MIYHFDPLRDRRWEELVEMHPISSIFHTPGWLEALRRTYGYEPVVYTTSPPNRELTNGIVFCRVSSRLTGKRLVSLPFSDHCDPLLEDGHGGAGLLKQLYKEQANQHWKYVEIRLRNRFPDLELGMNSSQVYCFHTLDLSPPAEEIFSGFHKKCTQDKVRRAERERLTYREGRSPDLLRMFYRLIVITRRKQRLPPQPFAWFKNLAECLGPAMQIRLALVGKIPAAGIVTLRFQNAIVLKYSPSDPKFHNLGGTQWLIWRAIREAKVLGLRELDLGRSRRDNYGLITFKERIGAKRFSLRYWQYPKVAAQPFLQAVFQRPVGWTLGNAPLWLDALAGRTLYRHIG